MIARRGGTGPSNGYSDVSYIPELIESLILAPSPCAFVEYHDCVYIIQWDGKFVNIVELHEIKDAHFSIIIVEFHKI